MTIAIHQWNTWLEYSQDAGANWTAVAEVTKIVPPKKKGSKAEATHLRSPFREREFVASWKEPGEASFELNYGSDSYVALNAFLAPDDDTPPPTHLWRVVLPLEPLKAARAELRFFAQVTGLSFMDIEAGTDNVHRLEVEMAVSGGAVFIPAT